MIGIVTAIGWLVGRAEIRAIVQIALFQPCTDYHPKSSQGMVRARQDDVKSCHVKQ